MDAVSGDISLAFECFCIGLVSVSQKMWACIGENTSSRLFIYHDLSLDVASND